MSTAVSESPAVSQSIHSVPVVVALNGSIAPVRVGVLYRAGLLLVAVVMLLLPLVYLALVAGAGYLVYLHIVHDAFIVGGRGRVALLRLIVYLAPIFVGGILVLFMIKPLFAREKRVHAPLTVDEREQPVLHAFVRKLADIVGARRPKRIDVDCQVNASASFDEGFWGFIRGDLVLTIGLPLVTGLSARQLSGIMAHELGHFAQGGAMRLTYIIRSINGWFARVVYQRDGWDDVLDAAMRSNSHWAVQAIAALAKLFVWITRQILKVLMLFGHGVSAFLLRQMEFDADRYEARIAGCDAFAEVASKLSTLSVASQVAFNDLSAAWREQRLCDDLPALVQWRESDMPGEIRRKVTDSASTVKTGWFDTHPCDADRIASARREKGAGLFCFEAPAATLFQDLQDLSRRATVAFYHRALGGVVRPEHLIPTESMVATRARSQQNVDALGRFFQGLISPLRPVFLEGGIDRIADRAAAAEILLDLRSQFFDAVLEARAASEAWAAADRRLTHIGQVKALRSAGIRKINASDFELPAADEQTLRQIAAEDQRRQSQAATTLAHALALGMQRLELAIRLDDPLPPRLAAAMEADSAGEYELREAAPPPGSEDRLEDALRCLSAASPTLETLRHQFAALGVLIGACRPQESDEHLISAVISASRKTVKSLTQLQDALGRVPYPYDHLDPSATMYSFVLKQLPPPDLVVEVYAAAEAVLEALFSLYVRLLSDLAARAEAIEQSLGMPPLAEPVVEPVR
jgi:Zn-dependent protease with chaperone function